jgi:MFS family permease
MGLLTGAAALSQMLAFGLGAAYEPWLGLRRVYVLLMVSLAGSLAAFAWLYALPALLAATVVCGVASAMGFQASIVAATRHFASARTGTTLHESLVGTAGLAPFAGGALATALKGADWPVLDALRAPFLALAGVAAIVLAVQVLLVGNSASRRLLAEEMHDGGDGTRGGTSGDGT